MTGADGRVGCVEYFAEVTAIAVSGHQHERAFHYVVDRLTRLYRCRTVAIVLIDRKTEYLHVESHVGLSHAFCKEFRRKLATGPIGELLWTGRPVVVPDADADPVLAAELALEHPFGSCLLVQMSVDHRTVGYLYADSPERGAFTEKDVPVFQAFADVASLALHRAQLVEENLRLDRIDHETELEKYGPFLQGLGSLFESAMTFDESLGVMILDVDNYKTIVNTYGYDASKQFLHELGELVRSVVRSYDLAARYGPDEIIIALPKTRLDDCLQTARVLREKVQQSRFTRHQLATSISIGVAAFPQNGRSLDDLILTAKQAVFEAQRAGRNKVYHYSTEWHARSPVLVED